MHKVSRWQPDNPVCVQECIGVFKMTYIHTYVWHLVTILVYKLILYLYEARNISESRFSFCKFLTDYSYSYMYYKSWCMLVRTTCTHTVYMVQSNLNVMICVRTCTSCDPITFFTWYSFNLLKLPEYPGKQLLKERLNIALTCGSGIIDIT